MDIGHVSQGFVIDASTTQKNTSSIFSKTGTYIRSQQFMCTQ